MKLLITFTLGISLISFYGCKKEIEPKNGNPTMEPSLLNLSNLPAVNGDRLQFNTWTRSWKKRSNGKWRKKRVTKSVDFEGKLRDDTCDEVDVLSGDIPSRKWYTITARDKGDVIPGGITLSNNENYSNHTLLGNKLTKSFYITPCP